MTYLLDTNAFSDLMREHHYANVKLGRQKKGLALDENDLWIAATALAIGAALVSRDTDFRQIDGLNVADWTV
jgi:tRNA(fMet)-specific endonuclease VapC